MNGEIFALYGLIDYYRVTQDEFVREYAASILNRMKSTLALYEEHAWVAYDLKEQDLANVGYYKLHIRQLVALGAVTEDSFFSGCCLPLIGKV